MKTTTIEALSNDLFARIRCESCGEPIRLTGYNDPYFFDKVNAEPRTEKCQCGTSFTYQWVRYQLKYQFERKEPSK